MTRTTTRGQRWAYAVSTVGIVAEGLIGGTFDVLRLPPFFPVLAELGYPAYLATILGVAKLIAGVALAAPRLPRLKEWAYAGIAVNMIGAAASQLAVRGDTTDWIPPVALLGLAVVSWGSRPPSRRLPDAADVDAVRTRTVRSGRAPATPSLVLRSIAFTLLLPGLGGVYVPWWIAVADGGPVLRHPVALLPVAAGAALYLWCAALFVTNGRGTPGPWDAPRALVVVGPYRWVRNPIYLAALLVVFGQAWLYGSTGILGYGIAMAVCFHAFAIGYEEPMLARRFGPACRAYLAAVPRWIPRPPGPGSSRRW